MTRFAIIRNMKRPKLAWLIGGVVSIAILSIVIYIVWPRPILPTAVKRQVSSTIFMPQGKEVSVDRQTVTYSASDKLLTYTAAYRGTSLVVSEQPTPDQFVDIPDTFTKLVNGLNNYETFETAAGKVYLTRPVQLHGRQSAVINSKGTLMFIRPNQDLANDQWRKLASFLTVIK